MGAKLDRLLPEHPILLVHPIAVETYLQKPGKALRKSPKRGSVHDLFEELVSVPTLIDHPNLTVEVALVSVVKHQSEDPKLRRGRGGFRTDDRELRGVLGRERFASTDDLLRLVPDDLPSPFTTADLAAAAGVRRDVAQRMAYVFRALDRFVEQGRTKAGIHYVKN